MIACAAASLLDFLKVFRTFAISGWKYIVASDWLVSAFVCSNSGFDQSEATIYILATRRDLKQDIVH